MSERVEEAGLNAGGASTAVLRARDVTKPRTALGFIDGMLAVLGVSAVGLAGVLAGHDALKGLLIGALVVIGVLFTFTITMVFILLWHKPLNLQLGQVTAKDYLAGQSITQGDSISGEFLEPLGIPLALEAEGPPKDSTDGGGEKSESAG